MKIILPLVLVIVMLVAFFIYRSYNRLHRSLDEEVSLSATASELFNQFEINEAEANAEFLSKVIEVTGEVSEVFKNQNGEQVVVLKTNNDLYGISCTMEIDQSVQKGSTVTIKGFCTGFLSDVVLNKCKIIIK